MMNFEIGERAKNEGEDPKPCGRRRSRERGVRSICGMNLACLLAKRMKLKSPKNGPLMKLRNIESRVSNEVGSWWSVFIPTDSEGAVRLRLAGTSSLAKA